MIAGQLPCTRSPIACCTNTSTGGNDSAASSDQRGSRGRPGPAHRRHQARHAQHPDQRRRQADLAADQFGQKAQCPGRLPVIDPAALPDKAGPAMFAHSMPAPARTTPVRSRTAAQGCHRRSQGRTAGTSRPTGRRRSTRTARCICCPAPDRPRAPRPATTRPCPPAAMRATAQNAAVQKNSSGESGVMITVPTPSNSEAFSMITAAATGLVPGNSARAASNSIHDASAAASGPSRRTPSAVCPAIRFPP